MHVHTAYLREIKIFNTKHNLFYTNNITFIVKFSKLYYTSIKAILYQS